MSDPDHSVVHEEALSGTLLRYLQRREERLAEKFNTAIAHFRESMPELQDRQSLIRSIQELARRIGALERAVESHRDRHARQESHLAKLNRYKKTRDRDEQGRLQDQLLIDLERRRVLLKLTQRQLADTLHVDGSNLSRWLARTRSPQVLATRQRLEGWLKETEAEAVRLDRQLADELAEWL